ncbi:hypothetical protein JTE90_028404 [Oedothorax gibbosus]|uniref:Uncharacterized protein n=1 Tax=Oedothorax gibbosus TaxID=931172 RepID=A0AAV6VGN2_9ARAC|nr:hypothetical protein JTE90_028404 [Oedothorax gibbosus]
MFPRGRNKLDAIDLQYNMISTLPNACFFRHARSQICVSRGKMIAVLARSHFQPVLYHSFFHLDSRGK